LADRNLADRNLADQDLADQNLADQDLAGPAARRPGRLKGRLEDRLKDSAVGSARRTGANGKTLPTEVRLVFSRRTDGGEDHLTVAMPDGKTHDMG
jgi:hypothetical protein